MSSIWPLPIALPPDTRRVSPPKRRLGPRRNRQNRGGTPGSFLATSLGFETSAGAGVTRSRSRYSSAVRRAEASVGCSGSSRQDGQSRGKVDEIARQCGRLTRQWKLSVRDDHGTRGLDEVQTGRTNRRRTRCWLQIRLEAGTFTKSRFWHFPTASRRASHQGKAGKKSWSMASSVRGGFAVPKSLWSFRIGSMSTTQMLPR